jgi:hypothetical protein
VPLALEALRQDRRGMAAIPDPGELLLRLAGDLGR